MAEAILDMLGGILSRWTMGAAAAPAATHWQSELGSDPGEAELRLLALSGQFLGAAVMAEPPPDLRALPDLPRLALPSVPDALRPLVRRNLAAMKEARLRAELLNFLFCRGWTIHPGDWMPSKNDENTPDIYAPWNDWAEVAESASPRWKQGDDALTADNWDDFLPAARKVALATLRRADPGAARALLEAKIGSIAADERLRLLALFANGLSEGDGDLLHAVAASDRAPRVKALAESLLGRLGHHSGVGDEAVELAAFFEVRNKGLLRRTRVVAPNALKTAAQANRRGQLFATVGLAAFAAAMGLTSEDLVRMWDWYQDDQADLDLAAMAAETAPERLIDLLAEMLLQQDLPNTQMAIALKPRLTPALRNKFAYRALAHGERFETVLPIAGGGGRIDGAIETRSGAILIQALKNETNRSGQPAIDLQALGLIASRASAIQAMDRLAAAGLTSADPRLDMLRLNAALDDKGTEE